MKYLPLVLLALCLTAGSSVAHHSFAATYIEDQMVTVEGDIIQFLYRNPHAFVHIEAPDDKGTTQRWAIEWSGGGQLANQGVTKESLKVGDQVVIMGRPSRVTGEFRALMVNLKRPADGFTWGGRGQVVA